MFPNFSICSVNARGLLNDVKRKAIFLYAKSLNTDFCFIQESHANSSDFKFWKSQWGDELFSSFGSNFSAVVVYTDRNPLTFLCRMYNQNQRQMRWALLVQKYNIEIRHKKGVNVVADALSRA